MLKKKSWAILLSFFMLINALGLFQVKVKANDINGWKQNGSAWNYYIHGSLKTGWLLDNEKWYYLNTDGSMATGWKVIGGTWYYLQQSGEMKVGWLSLGGKWYSFNTDGSMATGWKVIGGNWYFLQPGGEMKIGWLLYDGKWYFLNINGSMATGYISISNKQYYLYSNGSMAVNTTLPNGNRAGQDGVIISNTNNTISAPTGLTLDGQSDGSIHLQWNPVDGADYYYMYWNKSIDDVVYIPFTNSDGSKKQYYWQSGYSAAFTKSDILKLNSTVNFVVTAVKNGVESKHSNGVAIIYEGVNNGLQ